MSLLDLGMFCETQNNPNNIGCLLKIKKLTYQEAQELCIEKNIKPFSKFRSKLVKVLGSFYLKPISNQEALKQLIKVEENIQSKQELESFLEKIVNVPFSIGEPHWNLYFIENYDQQHSILIYKAHHYVMDGLTSTFFICAMNDIYDVSTVPELPVIGFWKKVYMSLLALWYIPRDLFNCNFCKRDFNPISTHSQFDGRKSLTLGNTQYKLNDIKKYAKELQMTVNGFMMGIISQSIKQYFQKKGFDGDSIRIVTPISIRFEKPTSVDKIDVNNLISCMIYKLPLINDFKTENKIIAKISNSVRTSLSWFSANYICQFWVAVLPLTLMYNSILYMCNKCTLIFSNVIGPKKTIYVKGKPIEEIYGFINGNPGIGLCIVLYSYNDRINFNILADLNRVENTRELADLIESNINIFSQSDIHQPFYNK